MFGRFSDLKSKPGSFTVFWLIFGLFLVFRTVGMTEGRGIERILIQETPPVERPNVLFIVIDALRRDHLGFFGYTRDTSPVLDRICREGIVFTDVASPSSQTAPVIASLFTGLYPHRHGVQFYSFNQAFDPVEDALPPLLPERFETLAEVFQSRGFTTAGIVSNPWLKEDYGYGQGFDVYQSIGSWDGRYVNETFIRWISGHPREKPFFAYLHYMDAHAPYHNPETFQGLFSEYKGEHIYEDEKKDRMTAEELEYTIALYDEEIRYVDGLAGKLFDELEKFGLMENTVVVVTADHGDEFFDHRGLAHGRTVYGELVNTFLILYCPEYLKPKRVEKRVSGLDIYPTLFDIAGFSGPVPEGDGLSLLPFIEGAAPPGDPPIFSELADKKAVFSGNWKYIYDPYLLTEELYDLDSDKGERFNLADRERKIRREMKEEALRLCLDKPGPGGTSARLSGEDLERLRSLGYVGETGGTLSAGEKSLRLPVTDRINFAEKTHNPLQLIYGEKGKAGKNGEGLIAVGRRLDFALRRSSKRQDQIVVEGFLNRREGRIGDVKIELFCEGGKMGERIIGKAGFFSVRFPVPSSQGKDRTLIFSLQFEGQPASAPLLISAIFFD